LYIQTGSESETAESWLPGTLEGENGTRDEFFNGGCDGIVLIYAKSILGYEAFYNVREKWKYGC